LERKSSYYKQFIAGDGNNQAGRDIINNNYVSLVKAKPANIELMAIRNYRLLYFILASILAIIYFFLIFYLAFTLGFRFNLDEDSSVVFTVFFITILLAAVSSIYGFETLLPKLSWGRIEYKDKSINFKGKNRKFYDEIWDMKLTKTWIGDGKIEYFAVNRENSKIYSHTIVFSNYAEAKYIYDSFWSSSKIL